ncbi:MAG: uracil-DNA glycosylase, partial [Nannocystaceae bacterium]
WEKFTDAVISALSRRDEPMVFVLWGGYAQKKKKLIADHHVIHEGAHPSPLSARNGFFGSKPYSTINHHLERLGVTPIDWKLPPV